MQRNCAVMAAALCAALSLSACGNAGSSAPQTPAGAVLSEVEASAESRGVVAGAVLAPSDLPGSYRVMGVREEEISLPHGITADVTDSRIELRSDCIGMAWSYRTRVADGALVIETESQPTRSCRRALLPEERALQEVLNAGGAVTKAPSGALVLTGDAGNVILYSQ